MLTKYDYRNENSHDMFCFIAVKYLFISPTCNLLRLVKFISNPFILLDPIKTILT